MSVLLKKKRKRMSVYAILHLSAIDYQSLTINYPLSAISYPLFLSNRTLNSYVTFSSVGEGIDFWVEPTNTFFPFYWLASTKQKKVILYHIFLTFFFLFNQTMYLFRWVQFPQFPHFKIWNPPQNFTYRQRAFPLQLPLRIIAT